MKGYHLVKNETQYNEKIAKDKVLFLIKKLHSKHPRNALLPIYKSLIRPQQDHGGLVWSTKQQIF